jgi:predicted HTH transcriptional regulator
MRSVSVLDQFRTAEEHVVKRLRELKPLVAEYQELEQVAQRLGLRFNEDATVRGKQRPASPKSTRRHRRGSATKARSAASTREASGNAVTAKTSAAPTQAPRVRSPRSSGDKGRPGSNRTSRRQQDVLRLVNQRPGITVSQIAKELGVDATGLYRPVHKLEQQGAITKQGAALQPTSR